MKLIPVKNMSQLAREVLQEICRDIQQSENGDVLLPKGRLRLSKGACNVLHEASEAGAMIGMWHALLLQS